MTCAISSPLHVFIFQANLSGPPSESFQSFQRSPLLGSQLRLIPDFRKKDPEKILQGNACHTIALYVRGKKFYHQRFGGKKILTQTHEITHTPLKLKWPAPNYM